MAREETKFVAEHDGKKFPTAKEADAHDAIRQAEEVYDTARRAYAKLLRETQQTADGKQFKLGTGTRYYRLVSQGIEEVNFYWWKMGLDDNDIATILMENNDGKIDRVHIPSLYADKRNAEIALVQDRRKTIGYLTEYNDKIEARLGVIPVEQPEGS